MVEIAKRKPTSLNALRNIPEVESIEAHRSGVEILKCIQKKQKTCRFQIFPEPLKRLIDFPAYKKVAKEIKQKITKPAERAGHT